MDSQREKPVDLKTRTREFSLAIIKLHCDLPKSTVAKVIGDQILRSGTSVGAHYREATRSRSDAEFVSKIEGGLQELEETLYWLELLKSADIVPQERIHPIAVEADEIMAIMATCAKKVKAR
jgi:four helix bundle protein